MKLRKPDEMESHMILRARSAAYLYTSFALLLWALYESYKVYVYHTPLNLLPCFVLVSACLVQGFIQLFLQRKAVKGETEAFAVKPLIQRLLLVAALLIIAVSVTAYLMRSGIS